MEKLKNRFESVRLRLFFSLCIVVILIIIFLIIINSVVLESVYLYSKTNKLKIACKKVNDLYNTVEINKNTDIDIEKELYNISAKNDFDIIIKNSENILTFSSDRNFSTTIDKINEIIVNNQTRPIVPNENNNNESIIYKQKNTVIRKIEDEKNSMDYLFLSATLDNENVLYIRVQIASIKESVRLSNQLLIVIGGVSILIAGIFASVISKKFTNPILELNDIAKNMSNLNFEQKYRIKDTDDEINNLGKSINIMSDKLEKTIKQLRNTNIELEKDIEEKSQIDEMRKQFISDVSHELKTPIALIQGYAEGLVENVNSDEESKKFYAEVILDESNKMDALVKQLLELMKLEYGKREFNNNKFNIIELINEEIRKCEVMLKDKNIKVEFENKDEIFVIGDEFYIDQVITNYFTNAIKNIKEINKEKIIRITIDIKENKVRVNVFNTGDKIDEENMQRIWKRFYKIDSSRNREDGGTGIGLALVKAIMNNCENDFGVENKENGVQFYFELDISKD